MMWEGADMSDKFEILARWGYAARGVVYLLLGVIALWGVGGQASPEGAFSTILGQPMGRVLLAAVALGLVGHVLWRLAQAFLNADHQKPGVKGLAARAGNLGSAFGNGALAVAAISMALGSGGGSGSNGGAISWFMGQPFGPWLVGAAGLALMAAGAVQVWRGSSGKFRNRIHLPGEASPALAAICVAGLVARGLLLAITGGFVVYAAIRLDPGEAGGMAQALDWIRTLPFGAALYALAAVGLVAFGLYSLIEARYRRLDAPGMGDVRHAAGKLGRITS